MVRMDFAIVITITTARDIQVETFNLSLFYIQRWQLVFISAKKVSKKSARSFTYDVWHSTPCGSMSLNHVTYLAFFGGMYKWITLAITNCCRTVGVTRHQTMNSSNTIFDIVAIGITITLANCERAWCCLKCFNCIFIRAFLSGYR